jgi:hypothetical protein
LDFEWLYNLDIGVLYPATIVLIAGAGELGTWIGFHLRAPRPQAAEIGTLTGAALGLVALLLSFSFAIALARYDVRRTMVLEEANALGSTANFALMLPEAAQKPILGLLRQYTEIRASLGVQYDPTQFDRDIARSVALQGQLWQQAVVATAAAPQSLPAYRFVNSLNEVNNIHERRITALRYHVPSAVLLMLVAVTMVAMGFTGYNDGVGGARRRVPNLIMSVTVAVLIMLVIDLDRPARGLIHVPVQALLDALDGIPK